MIIVAAALIEDGDRILLAERGDDVHLAGRWEFPGGKLEAGETPAECLRRELLEELGVQPTSITPLTFVHHAYAECEVLLLLFRCTIEGDPRPLVAKQLGWFAREEAVALPLPEADIPLLEFVFSRPRQCAGQGESSP